MSPNSPLPPHDPLPRYTRDPETTSVHSSAPSYTSNVKNSLSPLSPQTSQITTSFPADRPTQAPSYHSSQTTTLPQPASALPNPRYVPGFGNCINAIATTTTTTGISSNGPVSRTANLRLSSVGEWSVTTGPQARQYQAVAHRRAMSTHNNSSIATPMPIHITPPTTTSIAPHVTDMSPDTSVRSTRCRDDEAALAEEGRSWDFLLAQMEDWRERERSWEGFRREGGRRGGTGRGLGLGKGWGRWRVGR